METNKAFKIGTCLVCPTDFSIRFDDDSKHSLQPKYIEVITYLAKHHPRVIPRQELIEVIWNGNEFSGEKALTNTIWHLRQNLAGANGESEVIETIRKGGYRLLVEPEWQEDQTATISVSQNAHETPQPIPGHTGDNRWRSVFPYLVICVLLITFIIYFYSQPANVDIPLSEQITREPGSELFVSASPDGRFLAYKWVNTEDQVNIYVSDRQQPQLPAKQLTFDDAKEGHSVWSNDGQYLYFSRKNVSRSLCEIVRLKVSTNQEERIATCPLRGGYYYIDISPDDKTLAFHGFSEPADVSGIYFVRLDEQNAKPVRFSCSFNCGYKDRDMAFSPDGETIAITRRMNWFSENVYLVDLESGSEQQLTYGERDIVGLTWHPKGNHIIYAAQKADKRDGFVLDIKSKKKQALNIEGFSYPSYAKKTAELFYQQRTEKYHISRLELNGDVASSPFPVVQSEFNHRYPDYSARADKIVYVSNESGHYELWLADNNGFNRSQLTNLKQSVHYPRWSYNGEKVAFLAPSDDANGDKIFIIDVRTKLLTMLPTAFRLHNRPTWSFDDSAIISAIYGNEFTDLFKISIEDGSAERLTFDGGRYGIMISPTTLLYTGENRGLWQMEIGGQPLSKLDKSIFNSRYAWVYDDNGVYFRQNASNHHQFMHYDFNQQNLKALVRLPTRMFQTYQEMSLNTEKGELLFTSNQYPQADIKKLNHPLLPR